MLINKSTAKSRSTPRKRQAKQFGCGYAAPCKSVSCYEASLFGKVEESGGVFVDDAPERGGIRRESAQQRQRLGSKALPALDAAPLAVPAVTVASPQELARVPPHKIASKFGIPRNGVQARPGREVAV